MSARATGLAVLVLCLAGCGGSAEEALTSETSAISGGELDAAHDAVFQEYTHWPEDDQVGACTATLIAPNLLLTARHCIAPGGGESVVCGRSLFGDAIPARSVTVTNDTIPGSASIFYHAAELRVPAEGNDTCGFDVALVMLEMPVAASQARPAVPRIDRHAEAGETYVAVGYGVDEFGEPTPGRMERGGLTVSCTVGDCGSSTVAPTEFVGEEGVCSGDSGGPALDADGKVVGVVSRGADPCERPVYGSVASWAAFLTEAALDAASVGGYAPPFWALTGSSDPPLGVTPEGTLCGSSAECQPGLVCYYATEPSAASCTRVCASSADCSDGRSCSRGFEVDGGGLCLAPGDPAPPSGGADEGCTVSRSRSGSQRGVALFGLVLLACLGRRRARSPMP